MKKLPIVLTVLASSLTLFALAACGEEPTLYKVEYAANGGEGTAPQTQSYEAGTSITVSENTFTYEGFEFVGWLYGETLYEAGDGYVVPEADTTFVAQWTEEDEGELPEEPDEDPAPAFTQAAYTYDRLGGGALELPIELDGAGLFYVQVNGTTLIPSAYEYDDTKKAIVISEDYVLSLELGTITVTAITDAETEVPVSCTVTVEQSLQTTFDDETTKNFNYGVDSLVTFSVGYNGTTPKKLLHGTTVVDEDYYTYDDDSFSVKAEYLSMFSDSTEYRLVLSNNDSYLFTVTSNIIFATDYDVVTEHDTTESNIGHNPLYQYYDNVSIVEGPEGMSGNVLKITPNTEEVTYDCNGYITLRASWWSSTWRVASFVQGKYYAITFDYMTEGTSKGDFCVKGVNTSTWKEDLLLGEENDGVLHHCAVVVSPAQFVDGIMIWAKFIGGSGSVYIDNFKIAQLDAAPSIEASAEYAFESGNDLALAFDPAGLSYTVLLDGDVITPAYEASQGKLVIPASDMEALTAGVYTLEIKTALVTLTSEIRVVDNRVSEFTQDSAIYRATVGEAARVSGSFESTVRLLSLKQVDKAYDSAYSGGWDFYHGNTTKNYADLVQFVTGEDGTGYIEIPASVAELFFGETQFVAEFSNGKTDSFVLNSAETTFFTNYDDSTIRGNFNGTFKDSPLESGMWGGAKFGVEEQSAGDNALYVRSTQGAAGTSVFTIKMHTHRWEWYYLPGTEGNAYRVTFEYQISSDLSDVYFYVMSGFAEDQNANFFGEYDQLDPVINDQYYKVRYNLIADGQVHTFDSGWFTYNSALRMMQIAMPVFEEADGRFVMVDDFRIDTSASISYPLANLGDYAKGQTGDYAFPLVGETITSVTINGNAIGYTEQDGTVLLNKTNLEETDAGEYLLVVTTDEGVYRKTVFITDDRVSVLTETAKRVVWGEGAFLAGEFDPSLTVTSLMRYGADNVWDNGGNAVAMKTEYITVTETGLQVAQALVDQAYKTGRYVVTLSNGKNVEFTLTSNIVYYSNYDETNVYVNIPGNSVICQDSSMREFVTVEGNSMLKYTPANATQGHSVNAMNGSGADNFFYTFENRNVNNYNWYDLYLNTNDTLIVTFTYDITLGAGLESYFLFTWIDLQNVSHTESLTGSGKFYKEIPLSEVKCFGVNCPASTPASIAGSYMLIDNIGVGIKDSAYLQEVNKDVVFGTDEDVTLKGTFADGLTVTSLKRAGENIYDASSAIGGAEEIDVTYVSLTESGLAVSAELINVLYGTTTLWATLSNGDVVRFELTSNCYFYTDYDTTQIHTSSGGNVPICQDTEMWTIVGEEGAQSLRYTPANATQGHSVNAMNGSGADNFVLTISNTTLGNTWWYGYALPADGKIVVTFTYNITLGEGLESHFQFTWIDAQSQHHSTALTGSGTFSIELNASEVVAFGINCPVSSPASIAGSYMDIDNYAFYAVIE